MMSRSIEEPDKREPLQSGIDIVDNGIYIHEIPEHQLNYVCNCVEQNNIWKEAARNMGYSENDIKKFEQKSMEKTILKSVLLLDYWMDLNHTVTELFVVLNRIKQYEAMAAIKDLVDVKYHKWLPKNVKQFFERSNFDLNDMNIPTSDIPRINFKDLEQATDNWNEDWIIGRGRIGIVFKGRWKNMDVAIKRINRFKNSKYTKEEENIQRKRSLNELRYLNSCHHDNILLLYGFCDDKMNPCLVYQYMDGGSLEKRLHAIKENQKPLTFRQRTSILAGIARGLQYLHTFNIKPLIHGDIKPPNILLDKKDVPKIGDFGLAREASTEPIEVSTFYEINPYLPPEYVTSRILSTKFDTYSYGVVLLEVITGLRPYDENREDKKQFLVKYIFSACKDTESTKLLIDKKMDAKKAHANLCKMLFDLAQICTDDNSEHRPQMTNVYQEIEIISNRNKINMDFGEHKDVPKIKYDDLAVATNQWEKKSILGRGGFGIVFKGRWKNTDVAVKRIERSKKGKDPDKEEQIQLKQSYNELRFLSSCRHPQVLLLLGFSDDGDNPCLIFEYMAGGSLFERLHSLKGKKKPLTFHQRKIILRGTAQGIQYLHTFNIKPLIHGDIKPGNILLDAKDDPKIGDFGLVREGSNESMKVSNVFGTLPYLPIEFTKYKKLSTKVDTFSYGVVMFEILTGLQAYDEEKRGTKNAMLVNYMNSMKYESMKLMDRTMNAYAEIDLCRELFKIAFYCTDDNQENRPEMINVFPRLDNILSNVN